MRRISYFIIGSIFGGVLGGAVVLLFAPGSGDETRTAIKERIVKIIKEFHTAFQERKTELEQELKDLSHS